MGRQPRAPRGTTVGTVGEALTRAVQREGAKLPARFTDEPHPDMPDGGRRITDTVTGLHADVLTTCFGAVRRVLSELFPDEA